MSPEHVADKRRYGRLTIPNRPHEEVMIALGIPLEETKRRRLVECTVIDGGRSVFVEYPEWWKNYGVYKNGSPYGNLLKFVLDIFYPYNGNGRLETVYLELLDLGRIPSDQLVGLQAKKIGPLPQPVR